MSCRSGRSIRNGYIHRYASREPLVHSIRRHFSFGEKVGLELPDVFRAQSVRRAVEITSKIFNCVDITFLGSLGVVAALEFFEHHLS